MKEEGGRKKEEGRKKYGKYFLWNVAQREVMSRQLVSGKKL
ncbi:hypothetical protein [Okeania sp. SIO3B5]|nr:hypothetical protein [Okeania sp. SIO3B5]